MEWGAGRRLPSRRRDHVQPRSCPPRAGLFWVSVLAIAAAISVTACGHVGKYTVRLDEPEVKRAQEHLQGSVDQDLVIETDAGHTLSDRNTRVISARTLDDGGSLPARPGPVAWSKPQTLRGALGGLDGGVQLVVVEHKPGRANRRLIEAGGITAISGAGVGLVGLVIVAGAVAIAGPANDTRRGAVGGGITMLVGAGVAIVGGLIALAGAAPAIEPGVPSTAEDLGRGRLRN